MIVGKRYYKIDFKLASALSLGASENYSTDKDIIYNGKGVPYIPATALAGIYRSFYSDDVANEYFGSKYNFSNSKIYVYDAEIKNDKYNVSKRDCVNLDKWKTSITGGKFDFEVIDADAEFVTYIEQDIYESYDENGIHLDNNVADVIADMWAADEIKIGGKTARGLGRVKTKSVKMKTFSFKDNKEKMNWLRFDTYDEKCWEDAIIWNSENDTKDHWSENIKNNTITLKLFLEQFSPITVRTYTTDISDSDYKQLTYIRYSDDKKVPVPIIPGTSWAGVFRHHIEKMGICNIENIFGYASQNSSKSSSVYFSESVIEDSKSKVVSRNSIDRFSGSTVENALFTEEICYGGNTCLEIEFDSNYEDSFYVAMAACIVDLNEGIISVGGETSIGHGIFKIIDVQCNKNKINIGTSPEEFYNNLISAIVNERRSECVKS